MVMAIESKGKFNSLEQEENPASLALDDIGSVKIHKADPLVFDGYSTNRLTGSFILIEQGTNATVATGILAAPTATATPKCTRLLIY